MTETPHPVCVVHTQGGYIETAPGIRVRRVSRPCGKPATWWGAWTDAVLNEDNPRPLGADFKKVPMRTAACDEHKREIEAEPHLLIDSGGQSVTCTWEKIE